jgi:hypothetical protein
MLWAEAGNLMGVWNNLTYIGETLVEHDAQQSVLREAIRYVRCHCRHLQPTGYSLFSAEILDMAGAEFEPDMLTQIIARYPGFTWANAEFINPETLKRNGVEAAVREAYRDRNLAYAVGAATVGRSHSELHRALEEVLPRPPKPDVTGLTRKEKEKVMDAYYRYIAKMERRHELYWRRPIWKALHPDGTEAAWAASEERRRAARTAATHKRGGGRRRTHRRAPQI